MITKNQSGSGAAQAKVRTSLFIGLIKKMWETLETSLYNQPALPSQHSPQIPTTGQARGHPQENISGELWS